MYSSKENISKLGKAILFSVKLVFVFIIILLMIHFLIRYFLGREPETSKTDKPGELIVWSAYDRVGGTGESSAGRLTFGKNDYRELSKATLYGDKYAYRSTNEFYDIPMKNYMFINIRAVGDAAQEYYPVFYNTQTKAAKVLPTKDIDLFFKEYNTIIKKCGVNLFVTNKENLDNYFRFVDEMSPSTGSYRYLDAAFLKTDSSNELTIDDYSERWIYVVKQTGNSYYDEIKKVAETPLIVNGQATYRKLLLNTEKSDKVTWSLSIFTYQIQRNGVINLLSVREFKIPRKDLEQKHK